MSYLVRISDGRMIRRHQDQIFHDNGVVRDTSHTVSPDMVSTPPVITQSAILPYPSLDDTSPTVISTEQIPTSPEPSTPPISSSVPKEATEPATVVSSPSPSLRRSGRKRMAPDRLTYE